MPDMTLMSESEARDLCLRLIAISGVREARVREYTTGWAITVFDNDQSDPRTYATQEACLRDYPQAAPPLVARSIAVRDGSSFSLLRDGSVSIARLDTARTTTLTPHEWAEVVETMTRQA